tara:strand:+ start:41 stop:475 length:435 start_codon:yes stop_codon:yes gene_type:complete
MGKIISKENEKDVYIPCIYNISNDFKPIISKKNTTENLENLENLRIDINNKDDEIINLLLERFEICKKIGDLKKNYDNINLLDTLHQKMNINDKNREEIIIERLYKSQNKLTYNDIKLIYSNIFIISKNIQENIINKNNNDNNV